jgi:hypothetical protein
MEAPQATKRRQEALRGFQRPQPRAVFEGSRVGFGREAHTRLL